MADKDYEKREEVRVPMETALEISLSGSVWHRGRSINVSYSGMLIKCDENLPMGETVWLNFTLPNRPDSKQIETRVRVVRQVTRRGRLGGLGVQFVAFRPGHQWIFYEYLDHILR